MARASAGTAALFVIQDAKGFRWPDAGCGPTLRFCGRGFQAEATLSGTPEDTLSGSRAGIGKMPGNADMINDHETQLNDLSEVEWTLISKLIPPIRSLNGSAPQAARAYVNGILWRMRTGEPWSQAPAEYGNHTSICRRFVDWRNSGVWQNVTRTLADVRAGKASPISD
jgi:transposase